MRPETLQDYCNTVRYLRQQFAEEIKIPLGLVSEYYSALLPQLLPFLQDYGIEYLLLPQHFIENEIRRHYSGFPTADESTLKRYCAQSAEAMQTGLFTYFAHPDIISFQGNKRIYLQSLRLLCREAKSCNVPLEIHLYGLWNRRYCSDRHFCEMAAEEGCRVILSSDAHAPDHLLKLESEEKARTMVWELGLELLEAVPLHPIC